MNVERRSLLKGMALGGLAGVAMGSSGMAIANAFVAPSSRLPATLVLVNGAVAGSAFLQAINASPAGRLAEVQRTDLGLDFFLALEQRLKSGKPQRVIGLLDDASAALVIDLARSSGARVQWLGQHTASAAGSQHRLLSSEAAHGCALQLGLQLNACGAGFNLTEQRLLGHQPPLQLAAGARNGAGSEQWAATLGHTLAMLGSDAGTQPPLAVSRLSPLTGTFVSFSIEA
ncbi:hypothetical protein D3C78_332990 [compost metagenome]